MGGSQSLDGSYESILNITTDILASTVSSNSIRYAETKNVFQLNEDSRHCRNVAKMNESNVYTASSSVFQNEYIYQEAVVNIVQKIASSQSLENDASMSANQKEKLTEKIQDIVNTSLTSESLVGVENSISNSTLFVQACMNSKGGINYINDKRDNIYSFYSNVYSQNSNVQNFAAQVSQELSGDQSAKAEGLVAVIAKIIGMIVLMVIVIAITIICLGIGGLIIYGKLQTGG